MCNLGLGCLGCFAQLLLPKCIPLSVWLPWFVFPLSTTHFVELMGFVAAQILQHNLERFLRRLSHSVCQLSDNADQVLSTPPALCVCLHKCWCCVHQWTSMCRVRHFPTFWLFLPVCRSDAEPNPAGCSGSPCPGPGVGRGPIQSREPLLPSLHPP